MKLSEVFSKIAVKRLSAVETDSMLSHQHEINGVRELVEIFGATTEKKSYPAYFLYLDNSFDMFTELVPEEGTVTWYDARARHPSRTEYRLYYSSSLLFTEAEEGDLLIIGLHEKSVWFIVAEKGSEIEAQLLWIFNLNDQTGNVVRFQIADLQSFSDRLNIIEQYILEQLGFKTDLDKVSGIDTEKIVARFGGKFPSTAELSAYAREVSGIQTSAGRADETLLTWWE